MRISDWSSTCALPIWCIVIPCQQSREVLLHARDHVGDLDITTELPGQGGDPRVIDAARDEAVVPRQVDVAVEREAVHRHPLGDPKSDRGDLAFGAAGVRRPPHSGSPRPTGRPLGSTPRKNGGGSYGENP